MLTRPDIFLNSGGIKASWKRRSGVQRREDRCFSLLVTTTCAQRTSATYVADVVMNTKAAPPLEPDSAESFLDGAVESVNKTIDADIKALMDAFDALVRLAMIKDKDAFRIAQERFEAEARADVMVRSAQSLTLLSHALKLSLLLTQTPLGAETAEKDKSKNLLNEEAKELIKSTSEAKKRCADAIRRICGIEHSPNTRTGNSTTNDVAMEVG